MSLSYEVTNWENGKTVLKAEHLRKIEKGITDIISENDAIYKDEDTRKSNEKQRQEEHSRKMNEVSEVVSDIQKDYDSLQKIIIDENASANLQNQIDQTNSQLEHIQNKTKEFINVSFFGVKGDGVTDNTAILQELLDNYESLYFPPGVYIATNLKLNSFNHIHGEGRKSHLKQKANTNNHFITCKTGESHSIKITSIYIDGNRNNQNTDNDGIHIVNSLTEIEYEQLIDHYLVIDNVYVEKCSGTGVTIKFTRECKINNLVIRQCKKDGLFFNGSDSSFSNCTISTCDVGYHFFTGGSRITNCKAFVNNVGFFFDSEYCSNIVMNSCDTQSNSFGYKLVNCKNINMSNILSDSDEDVSIVMDDVKSCYIQGVINDTFSVKDIQGIHIKNNTSNCKIDIITNSNKLHKFIEKVVFDKCISSNEVIVNNNNLLKNIFKYDPLLSKINKKYNTLNNVSSSSINFNTEFINDKMVITVTSNDDITNYATINFETDFIDLPLNYKLGASASLTVERGENITPSVNFVCANSTDVLGKIPAYITSPESNSICVNSISNESSLPVGTTKVKVSFAFDTKQIASSNSLVSYRFSISNPKITII